MKILDSAIRKCVTNIKVENCLGNDLKGCKNCFQCFRILDESENLRYVGLADRIKDMMDFLGGSEDNWCYESTGIAHGNMIKFSYMVRTGIELEYCGECNNCENCFACFGLKNKKFCVFNRQYEQEEYWKIVDKIKTDMLRRGEYGEFFPLKYSAHGYNDSNAIIEFPMTKQEVLNMGWHWQDRKIPERSKPIVNGILDDEAEPVWNMLECGGQAIP